MKRQLNVLLLVFAAANLFLVNNTSAQDSHPTIYTVDDIIEKASVLVGQTVTVKGKVQHICQQTGRKLFLETADGKNTFRFNAGVEIDKFNENVLDSTVVATGIVAEQRLSLEDISKQEASGEVSHHANFIDAIRTGKNETLNCPITDGFYSSVLPLMANISYRLGRSLKFSDATNRFINDPEADKMLTREYRKPYVVPDVV